MIKNYLVFIRDTNSISYIQETLENNMITESIKLCTMVGSYDKLELNSEENNELDRIYSLDILDQYSDSVALANIILSRYRINITL